LRKKAIKAQKRVIYILTTLILLTIGFGLSRSGDLFLSLVSKELNIDLTYKNNSGVISCFILRRIALDKPVLTLKDVDLEIACSKAFIKPGFSQLFRKKAIMLVCRLEDASFLQVTEKMGNDDEFQAFFQGGTTDLMERLISTLPNTIETELILHDDTVDITYFKAASASGEINASGFINDNGEFDITGKIRFPPEIAREFPEELRGMLTMDEATGWMSYSMHIRASQETPSFLFESDRLRINIKQVKVE